jgi:NAD(P)-dependent dehydrogenase (short-subunit alcohol dehydrogenase family)
VDHERFFPSFEDSATSTELGMTCTFFERAKPFAGGKRGARINTISPGIIITPLQGRVDRPA